jgi:DNA invertase Pin-like site-specific DNA recombinase
MIQKFRCMVIYYGVLPSKKKRPVVPLSDDRAVAERYEHANAGHILEHYLEHGRAHRSTRPALFKAVQRAKEANALLVIPRFEPLARDAVFLKLLLESGVEFAACDNEHANQTTLPLLASLVIKQSHDNSTRAKAALEKRKRRKSLPPLGTPENLTQDARLRGGEQTKRFYRTLISDDLHHQLLSLRSQGKSLRQIAATLSDQGRKSNTGRPWSHTHIKRLLNRCETTDRLCEAERMKWKAKKEVEG